MNYLFFKDILEIHKYPSYSKDINVLIKKGSLSTDSLDTAKLIKQYLVDETAVEILNLIDGTHTLTEIIVTVQNPSGS